MMRFHASFDRISLVREGDFARFTYHAAVRHGFGYHHYAMLASIVMLTLAKPYFGKKSIAQRIEFDFEKPKSADS